MQKVLIADSSEEFGAALAEDLGRDTLTKICMTGKDVLEQIREFHPDGIVFDLTLSGADGLAVLQSAEDLGCQAPILVTTRFLSDYMVDALGKLHVGYLMVKPCNPKTVAARLTDMIDHSRAADKPVQEPRNAVSNILLELGLSAKRRGFLCVREAILIKSRNPGQSITKELYPAVGELFDSTGEQVEHVIRTAIANAWKNGNRQIWGQYFPQYPDHDLERPSNGEFISRLSEYLLR